jgi:hypothetical protein
MEETPYDVPVWNRTDDFELKGVSSDSDAEEARANKKMARHIVGPRKA